MDRRTGCRRNPSGTEVAPRGTSRAGLTRPQAIRALVEVALSSSAPRPTARNPARAARAVELAAKVIDKHLADAPAEKREARRRELLHCPSGFRNVRKDHAG